MHHGISAVTTAWSQHGQHHHCSIMQSPGHRSSCHRAHSMYTRHMQQEKEGTCALMGTSALVPKTFGFGFLWGTVPHVCAGTHVPGFLGAVPVPGGHCTGACAPPTWCMCPLLDVPAYYVLWCSDDYDDQLHVLADCCSDCCCDYCMLVVLSASIRHE